MDSLSPKVRDYVNDTTIIGYENTYPCENFYVALKRKIGKLGGPEERISYLRLKNPKIFDDLKRQASKSLHRSQ